MTKFFKLPFIEGTAYPVENKSRKNTLKSVKNLDKKSGNGRKTNTKFYRRDN